MKVCFIGLGSIASRHIKNLVELYRNQIIIDALRSGKGNNADLDIEKFINCTYYNYDELPRDYDVIFITNPTNLHFETLKKANEHAKNFFIEKPIFQTGEESVAKLNLEEEKTYYVACPLRYTNVISYLKKNIDFSHVYSIRCISSSYLPEWRPGIDYRKTYSAKKEFGGGVSIDLIHEWDYISYLIGFPKRVQNFVGKKSNLEINSDDVAIYIAEYADKVVELHLDYFGRIPTRRMELYCKDDTMEVDLIDQKICFLKEKKFIHLSQDRNDYQKKELKHFFDIIEGSMPNDNSIELACKTLRIARGIY